MNLINWKQTAAASEEEIQALESELGGITLPQTYRQFLKEPKGSRKGGELCYLISNLGGGNESILHGMYGVSSVDSDYDVREVMKDLGGELGPDLLPIGYDPGNSQLVMALRGELKGNILFWDWETQSHCDEEGNPYLVAKSFDEFDEALHLCED